MGANQSSCRPILAFFSMPLLESPEFILLPLPYLNLGLGLLRFPGLMNCPAPPSCAGSYSNRFYLYECSRWNLQSWSSASEGMPKLSHIVQTVGSGVRRTQGKMLTYVVVPSCSSRVYCQKGRND